MHVMLPIAIASFLCFLGEVMATDTHEWEIEVSGPLALSVNWQHPLALVSGQNKQWQAMGTASAPLRFHLQASFL